MTLEKAGIREGGTQPRLKRVRGFVCDVCYDDETKETLALTCDHRCESERFSSVVCCATAAARPAGLDLTAQVPTNSLPHPTVCKACYCHYLTSKIVDEGESRRIECMGKDCHVIVDEKTVELLVPPDILDRCVRSLCRSALKLR